MPLDGMIKTLLDSGGLAIGIAVTIGIIVAIIRGDLVPGSVYRREAKRADTATAQLERNTELGEKLTTQVETLAHLVADVLRAK